MATKADAGAFRDQSDPQKLFADSGSFLETWVEIDCITRSSPGRPGGSDFSLIGDPGCPG